MRKLILALCGLFLLSLSARAQFGSFTDVGAGANLLSFGRFQNVDGIGAGLGWFQR